MNATLKNARRLLTHRRMLPAYLNWCASRGVGRAPSLGLPLGGRLSEFRDFSEFWSNRDLVPSPGEQRLIRSHLRPGGVALDIGANLGMFSVLMGKTVGSATIHAFEPARETYGRLAHNLRRNGLENVVAHHSAVGDRVEAVRLAIDPKSSAINRLARADEAEGGEGALEDVPCTTVDAFCQQHAIDSLDWVKIDVEGAEPRVLAGAVGMLRRRAIRCLLVEVCPGTLSAMGYSPRDLVEAIRPFDYRFHLVSEDGEIGPEIGADRMERMSLANVAVLPTR